MYLLLLTLRLKEKFSLALIKEEDGPLDYSYDDYGDLKSKVQGGSGVKHTKTESDKEKDEIIKSDKLGNKN